MKILVTGANGQLGNEIKKKSNGYKNLDFIFTDIEILDITDKKAVSDFFEKNKIDFIVNCAAYTNVDGAESNFEFASKINITGVKRLAEMSVQYECPIIHLSTDYVYDGRAIEKPYFETDITNPVSAYGKTKLESEKILEKIPKHIIIRTSWLYSSFGKNFLKTIIKLAKQRNKINVIFDQIGTPTFAGDLAEIILKIIVKYFNFRKSFEFGIYNYSNEGVCSWYDFAYEIIEKSNLKCKINPIETKDYPTPAKRPHFSVLNKSKIKKTFNIEIPHWRKSMEKCFEELDV